MKHLMSVVVFAVQVSAFSAFAEQGDAYVTEKGAGVYEIDATGGLTPADFSAAWTNRFVKSASETFVFKGAGDKGMSLDFPLFTSTDYKLQLSHVVYSGGLHSYRWGTVESIKQFKDNSFFASGGTPSNPSVRLADGATLLYDQRSRMDSFDNSPSKNNDFEIAAGCALVVTNSFDENVLFKSRVIIQPGGELQLSLSDANKDVPRCFIASKRYYEPVRYDATEDNFVVPAAAVGETRVARITSLNTSYLRGSVNVGFNVGANATLAIDARTTFYSERLIKHGPGTLIFTGDVGLYWAKDTSGVRDFYVKEGALAFKEQKSGYLREMKVHVYAGATFILDAERQNATVLLTDDGANLGTIRFTNGTSTIKYTTLGKVVVEPGAVVNYVRTIDPTAGRAPYEGETLDRLTLVDANGETYAVTSCDGKYVYWDYVQELAAGTTTAIGVIHSLDAVNATPESPATTTVTGDSFAIGHEYVTLAVAENITLDVQSPISGTVAAIRGAGDLALTSAGAVMIREASDFSGTLTIRGGVALLPSAIAGQVALENEAVVRYFEPLPGDDVSVQLDATAFSDAVLLSTKLSDPAHGVFTVAAEVVQDRESVSQGTLSQVCDGMTSMTIGGLQSETTYGLIVTLTDSQARVRYEVLPAFTTSKLYRLTGGERDKTSFRDGYSTGPWQNAADPSDQFDTATVANMSGRDFLVDATQAADPNGQMWGVLSFSYSLPTIATEFLGGRLIVRGTRDPSRLTYETGKNWGGILCLYSQATVANLRLENGTVAAYHYDKDYWLTSRIEIPAGFGGFFAGGYSSEQPRLGLRGSAWGEGTMILHIVNNPETSAPGVYLDTDLSDFRGKLVVQASHNHRIYPGFVPQRDLPSLVSDAVVFDNRHPSNTTMWQALRSAYPNRLYFLSDLSWSAVNRGITIEPGSADQPNVWDFAVTNGATVALSNPLYGSGALGLWDEEADYRGTLKLCANKGDWTGAFSPRGGKLVLAGTKPLGEGTLAATADSQVELDTAALAGETCYVKAATPETRIRVTLPETLDPAAGLRFLSTPADGGLRRENLVVANLPDGMKLASTVVNGQRVFGVEKKRGLLVIFR